MNSFAFLRQANNFLCHLFAYLTALCLLSQAIVLAYSQVGETYPRLAQILIGGDVNITCIMHNRTYFGGNNSSCLTFSEERRKYMIPKENIHIVNETSIVFVYRNATAQASRYVCKCNGDGVDATIVDVGTSPTEVTDFQCIGYDFAHFTCKFTIPPNNLTTNYKLKFWTKKQDYTYNCTLENGALPSERICNMTLDNRIYRTGHPTFTFNLTANNFVGNATQTIVVDHFSRVIPAIPKVKITNITDKGVTISWNVSKLSFYDNTNYLFYEIRLRPDNFDWIDIDNSSIKQSNMNCWVHINDLKYAFRRYNLTVRVKTGLAWKANDDTMWSDRFEETFVTKPRVPDSPPVIDVGSFYIDPKEENLRIYWQQLPEWKENGRNFSYNFTEVRKDGDIINVSAYAMDQTSATYKWQSTSHYEFKVKSQNEIGQSENSSSLKVSPSRERSMELEQIQTITKVFHNQAYTVSWWKPSDMDNLIDFTLFWCISKMESQSQCKGTISSQHFDKNTYNYTTEPQNHTLNFAVSANYRFYSTGMIWAMCTADVSTELTKMDPETMATSSNSIKLQWSTECLYKGILEGYNLTYCKVENKEGEMIGDCINAEKNVSISKNAKEYTITGLEPFTTYKILIMMYSKAKVGPMSNALLETTTEDAPTPPRNLKHYNVTSNSVILSWLPPIHSNGVLQSYTVWHNSEKKIVNITSNDTESLVTFKLNELSSFSDYKIYVTAQTVKSSVPSNDIHFKTLIGFPSVPRSINLETSGNSHILHWDKPQVPSGRVEFYEIQVLKNNETVPNTISRVVGNNCRINIPSCDDNSFVYNFEVRSVNVVENSKVDYQIFSKRDTSLYATIHQGAAKRRRHSNAEINSSIGGPYLIHENTDRHLRHRHERENLKPMSSSTTEQSKALDSPLIMPASFDHYDSNEDFLCIGSEPVPQHYLDEHQYKHFQSAWNKGSSYACGPQSSKSTMFALAGVVIMLVMFAAVYSARKKYDKMSNIGLMLPAGLEENIHTPKGVDNTIDRDEIARNDELFYEKESHSLLSKIGNDSGILNSARSLDKKSAYVCSDHQDSEKSSQSTDSVELNDVTSCSYTSSPSHSPNANIRENATNEDKFTPAIIQPISVQLPPPTGNSLFKPMIPSNGYVQPQAFQRLQAPSFNGYTTLDAMGKAMLPQGSATVAPPMEGSSFGLDSKNFSNKDVSAPQPMNGNICGYVTCKQLSDFGQSLQ